jgi:hypothetical protein
MAIWSIAQKTNTWKERIYYNSRINEVLTPASERVITLLSDFKRLGYGGQIIQVSSKREQ